MSGLRSEGTDSGVPSLVVVSDIRLYREGLQQALNADGRVHVIAVAATLAEAMQCARLPADVIMIDVAVPGALDAIAPFKHITAARIVALGVAASDAEVVACAEAGIDGFVAREASLDCLIEVVISTVNDELQCSPRLAATLFKRLSTLNGRHARRPVESMTRREHEVLELLGRGLSNKQIAAQLCIEVATVKNHVHNVLMKAGARRRSELAAKWRLSSLQSVSIPGAGRARQTYPT